MNTATSSAAFPDRFIDTHIHLWDRSLGLDYSWLDGDASGPLGRLPEVGFPVWDAARFAEEVRFHRPGGIVHVQASSPPTPAIDETRWLAQQRAKTGIPDALVVRADLRSSDLEAELVTHRAIASAVGVRDMSLGGSLDDPRLVAGLTVLERLDLVWEIACSPDEFALVAEHARQHSGLHIVLGHGGWPERRDAAALVQWQNQLGVFRDIPSVVGKLSGLAMGDHIWTVDSLSPWIRTAIEVLSPERTMFGSNWPLGRIYASYADELLGIGAAVADLNAGERDAFWYSTAARVFSLIPTQGMS
jgi:predicted TIM-barrel fold metal-dependent hydrolase